jgi:hypothetical protein
MFCLGLKRRDLAYSPDADSRQRASSGFSVASAGHSWMGIGKEPQSGSGRAFSIWDPADRRERYSFTQ